MVGFMEVGGQDVWEGASLILTMLTCWPQNWVGLDSVHPFSIWEDPSWCQGYNQAHSLWKQSPQREGTSDWEMDTQRNLTDTSGQYQLGGSWLLILPFIKAFRNTHWRAARLKGNIIFGSHTFCFRRKWYSRKTYKGWKTANIMTLKTGEKFHTESFTSSERESVKIIIRVMMETCCNQEIEICSI